MGNVIPVLIGAGQFTYRGDPAQSPSPVALLKIAAERAAADAGIGAAGLAGNRRPGRGRFHHRRAGLDPQRDSAFYKPAGEPFQGAGRRTRRWSVYSHMGGNTPQQLVNVLAERIARGETELGLAVGAEFLGSAMKRLTKGLGVRRLAGGPRTCPRRSASAIRGRA